MQRVVRLVESGGGILLALNLASAHAWAGGSDDPYADVIIDFNVGTGGASGYDNPSTALGSPERFTGEGVFPAVVSPFSPAFGTDEIVSFGTGGWLTVKFDSPVTNDAANPYGIDLLIFGNTGFIDSDWPNGTVGGVFGADGGVVEVSQDGRDWFEIAGVQADGLFPTMGYLDSGPYDDQPGTQLSDFTKPVDPSLTIDDFLGLNYDDVRDLYDGSGGGAGVDIGSVGLDWIEYIRVSNPGGESVEIDGFSDVAAVPAPGGMCLLGLIGIVGCGRRRR